MNVSYYNVQFKLCVVVSSSTVGHFMSCWDPSSPRATQFRWIQKEGSGERHSWGVDHVYIGEACPGLCSGHGYCTSGAVCICDEGHQGKTRPRWK